MSSHKILGAVVALAFLAASHNSADAQYFPGTYTTYYQPYTSYYNGPTTAYYGGGNCCGSGSGYTSYYGGSYGYGGNPFAPLVPSPYSGGGWFGSGYTAAYGPVGYGYGGGCCSPCSSCSPCGGSCGYGCSSGCASGNCNLPASSQQMKPSPDNGVPMNEGTEGYNKTYDETNENPMDDPNFRRSNEGSGSSGTEDFPGGFGTESFKIPMNLEQLNGNEGPESNSQPDEPLDADKPSVPTDQFNLYVPSKKPISERNSARVEPASHLDNRISWRSQPTIVPARQALVSSRPLIVRKTVKVQLTPPATLLSQSFDNR